jgi:hypothetical protein
MPRSYNTINPIEPSSFIETTTKKISKVDNSWFKEYFNNDNDNNYDDKFKCKFKNICFHISLVIQLLLLIIVLIFVLFCLFILLDILTVWYNSTIDKILTYLFGADAYSKYYAICNPNTHPTE